MPLRETMKMLWPIDLAEYLVVRFQNATGIPRYKLVKGIDRCWGILVVAEGHALLKWWGIGMLLVLFSATAFNATRGRFNQDLADSSRMIVVNPSRSCPFRAVWRTGTFIGIVCYSLFVQICEPSWFVLIVSFYVDACNTFPMQGPTLWDRLRNLLTFRKGALSHG